MLRGRVCPICSISDLQIKEELMKTMVSNVRECCGRSRRLAELMCHTLCRGRKWIWRYRFEPLRRGVPSAMRLNFVSRTIRRCGISCVHLALHMTTPRYVRSLRLELVKGTAGGRHGSPSKRSRHGSNDDPGSLTRCSFSASSQVQRTHQVDARQRAYLVSAVPNLGTFKVQRDGPFVYPQANPESRHGELSSLPMCFRSATRDAARPDV